MEPHDFRGPFKRSAISDQRRRRELALHRQSQQPSDSQNRARSLASSDLSLLDHSSPAADTDLRDITEVDSLLSSEKKMELSLELEAVFHTARDLDAVQASKLRGSEARHWFARQLMLPEWMIDVPPDLDRDWHAHYQTGNAPLALAMKDECCSHYLLDTDSKGEVPAHQQVVLVLQNDG